MKLREATTTIFLVLALLQGLPAIMALPGQIKGFFTKDKKETEMVNEQKPEVQDGAVNLPNA